MDSPIKYITSFITNYKLENEIINIEHFQSELYKLSILSKLDNDNNLLLLYHKFDQPSNTDLEKECRSLVLNTTDLSVISYTCDNILCNNDALPFITETNEVYKCYEGSLLSLFNHNNKWFLSTRRCLDSKESVWKTKSHYDMFIEVLNKENITFEEFTNNLNINNNYYFVLIHHENQNIINYSPIFGENYTKLCLAFIRDKETQQEVNIKLENYNHIFMPELTTIEEFNEKNNILTLNIDSEGIIIKSNNRLLKLQYKSFLYLKTIGSELNIFKGYIYLYQNSMLLYYIKNYNNNSGKIINPKNMSESYDIIGVIDSIFKVLSSELFELFKIFYNIKNGEKQNIELYNFLPVEYKNILFNLKGIYYKIKSNYITSKIKNLFGIKNIYQYLKNCNVDIVYNLLKYRRLMFNWSILNPEIQFFKNISIKCEKINIKLTAIYTSKLFPDIMPTDIPNLTTPDNTNNK